MATIHKPSLMQKLAGYIGKTGERSIQIKRTLANPHEEAVNRLSKKLQKWSQNGTGRKGPIRNRAQTYNPATGKFVKIDTKNHKIMSNSDHPYKGVRKIKKRKN